LDLVKRFYRELTASEVLTLSGRSLGPLADPGAFSSVAELRSGESLPIISG
jgi:hypothetical protein